MAVKKVLFGVPTEGHTPSTALQSLLAMHFHHGVLAGQGKYEFYTTTSGRIFTPLAREKLMDSAREIGADYLFMIDDDMLAPPDLFDRLVRHDVDVVSPLAFTRNPPYSPVLYRTREGWDPINRREYHISEWIRSYPKDKLLECDAVGFGSVLIKMSSVAKMSKPYFMSACGTGEDILFCINAKKQCGCRIFMDTSTKLGHISHTVIVDETFSDKVNDPAEMEKLFGDYERHRVLDVILPPKPVLDKDGTEVLAGL